MKAIDDQYQAEKLALLQDYEGNPVLDTPSKSSPKRKRGPKKAYESQALLDNIYPQVTVPEVKEEVQEIKAKSTSQKVVQNPVPKIKAKSTSQTMMQDPEPKIEELKRKNPLYEVEASLLSETKKHKAVAVETPVLTQGSTDQALSEGELQDILNNTDLLQCFKRWVRKQGALHEVLKKVTISFKRVAVSFRLNLEGHETCYEPLKRLNEKSLGLVYVRLCVMKERDDQEASL